MKKENIRTKQNKKTTLKNCKQKTAKKLDILLKVCYYDFANEKSTTYKLGICRA